MITYTIMWFSVALYIIACLLSTVSCETFPPVFYCPFSDLGAIQTHFLLTMSLKNNSSFGTETVLYTFNTTMWDYCHASMSKTNCELRHDVCTWTSDMCGPSLLRVPDCKDSCEAILQLAGLDEESIYIVADYLLSMCPPRVLNMPYNIGPDIELPDELYDTQSFTATPLLNGIPQCS